MFCLFTLLGNRHAFANGTDMVKVLSAPCRLRESVEILRNLVQSFLAIPAQVVALWKVAPETHVTASTACEK